MGALTKVRLYWQLLHDVAVSCFLVKLTIVCLSSFRNMNRIPICIVVTEVTVLSFLLTITSGGEIIIIYGPFIVLVFLSFPKL